MLVGGAGDQGVQDLPPDRPRRAEAVRQQPLDRFPRQAPATVDVGMQQEPVPQDLGQAILDRERDRRFERVRAGHAGAGDQRVDRRRRQVGHGPLLNPPRQLDRVGVRHPHAPVRGGLPEGALVRRPVQVQVQVELDLDPAGRVVRPGRGHPLAGRPLERRGHPPRVPDEPPGEEITQRGRMFRGPNGDPIALHSGSVLVRVETVGRHVQAQGEPCVDRAGDRDRSPGTAIGIARVGCRPRRHADPAHDPERRRP